MKRSTKVLLAGGGLFAVGALVAAAASAAGAGDSGGGGTPEGQPGGTWQPSGSGFAGGGAGGSIGGLDVTEAVLERGKLPPGSVLISGPNLPGRIFAAGWYKLHGIDFGFIDAAELDNQVPEEGIEGDIETAQLVIAAVSPQGDRIRWYVSPPRTPEEMGAAVENLSKFSGQTPT